MSAFLISDYVWENNTQVVLARILKSTGAAAQQADVSSIALKVYNVAVSTSSTVYTESPTVANVIFDTLQTGDVRWTLDSTGFNFAHVISDTAFPLATNNCKVEYVFTMSTGQKITLNMQLVVKEMYGQ